MNTLIRIFSLLIARQIESGSRVGVFIGTILGIAVSVLIWILIYSSGDSDTLRYFRVAGVIIAAVIGGMIGAMAGGRLIKAPAPLPRELIRQVKIYRINETIAYLILSLLLLGFFILCFFISDEHSKEPMTFSEKVMMMGAILLASIGLMVYFCRQVVSISISERISLRKPFKIIDITDDLKYASRLDLANGPKIENVTSGLLSIAVNHRYVVQKKLTANECRNVVIVADKFKHRIEVR